ncbi:hypothetical protein Smic_09190 [Streptomyces microflavus]|uniref:Uncharacterized protein n=1 Tax=Streptomyces microflavus TaxID=1919 RepID=A0A7J0CIQ0_STRMI|nr:hypothetical protein Smic_09190 [Streptomyces microflavus]
MHSEQPCQQPEDEQRAQPRRGPRFYDVLDMGHVFILSMYPSQRSASVCVSPRSLIVITQLMAHTGTRPDEPAATYVSSWCTAAQGTLHCLTGRAIDEALAG